MWAVGGDVLGLEHRVIAWLRPGMTRSVCWRTPERLAELGEGVQPDGCGEELVFPGPVLGEVEDAAT